MLNVVAIMGRLVYDPELKQTTGGKHVCNFKIACESNFRNAEGKYPADFFGVTAYGKAAEFICRYFSKGSLIAIDGRLQSHEWQDKQGNKRTQIDIVAYNVNFAGAKQAEGSNSEYNNSLAAMPPKQGDDDFIAEDADDIPF